MSLAEPIDPSAAIPDIPAGFSLAESVFMSVCFTALERGVGLTALWGSVQDDEAGLPWITLGDLQRWCQKVDSLVEVSKVPPDAWLDFCAAIGLHPITGDTL